MRNVALCLRISDGIREKPGKTPVEGWGATRQGEDKIDRIDPEHSPGRALCGRRCSDEIKELFSGQLAAG